MEKNRLEIQKYYSSIRVGALHWQISQTNGSKLKKPNDNLPVRGPFVWTLVEDFSLSQCEIQWTITPHKSMDFSGRLFPI